jgi:hypothetical protein
MAFMIICIDTTLMNFIFNGVLERFLHALIDHPDQYRMLVDDPSLVPSATEEILRWASPVQEHITPTSAPYWCAPPRPFVRRDRQADRL